nr:transposase [Sphaerisporangium perillae]
MLPRVDLPEAVLEVMSGGMVVAGTPRDSLYALDVPYDRHGGKRPETIVTDPAGYSDIIYGLLTLAGFSYAPQLADLPDQKPWRIDSRADYGPYSRSHAAASPWTRSKATGTTSAASSPPSTPVPCAPTTSSGCCRATAAPPHWAMRSPVHDEDVARLSPFIHAHVNMLGRYSFALPELLGGNAAVG